MRRAASLFGAGLTVFFVMFSAGPAVPTARAADVPSAEAASTPGQRAKQHYLRGEAYFKSKNFSEAMDEYQKGYLEKPDPVFIFNIAQCQRLLGNSSAAVEFYQRYLKEAPQGPGRPVAEREIAALRSPAPVEVAPPTETPIPVIPLPPPLPPAAPEPAIAAAPPPAAPPPAAPAAAPPPAAPPPEAAPPAADVAPVTAPPLPAAPAPATDSAPVYVTAQTQPDEKPVYTRWYFWTAIAALVVSTVIVASATSSSRPSCDAGRVCK